MLILRRLAREEIELPAGTSLNASLVERYDDEEEPDYLVYEEVPKTLPVAPKEVDAITDWSEIIDVRDVMLGDDRAMTLRVDTRTIMVKHVKAVNFDAASYNVRRHRWSKPNREPF